jgi:glutamate---cysteine ligase / carboxylate-amine ligase
VTNLGSPQGFDAGAALEVFQSSRDFTVGLEEEFALLEPRSLDMANAFERVEAAALQDDVLCDSVAGELISSEIEIRSGKGEDFGDAQDRQRERRARLFGLVGEMDLALGATGTHPWSPWQEQHIIDTPHYRRVEEGLKYVAWRNNTFSNHIHVGIGGADRAVAVCDTLRPVLPVLLAMSANSAWAESRFSGLHSARTEIFTRMFPRCGVPDHFGGWREYADYVKFLYATNSIVEHTQIWWSIRPHFSFGTVELRIMDAQARGDESTALQGLATACIAQAALDYDAGLRPEPVPGRLIEENVWRATRYGLDGRMIDLPSPVEIPARAAVERLVEWAAPARSELRLDSYLAPLSQMLEEGNGAQRQWRAHEAGTDIRDTYSAIVAETRDTYAPAVQPATR